MDKKILIQFTAMTFCISIITWGICVVCGFFGITVEDNFVLYIPFVIGGFSPAIASYLILKKNNEVTGFKNWIKNVFAFKISFRFYLLVLSFNAIYFVSHIIIDGIHDMNPFYLFFILLPLMPLGGGMEEAGWRYILQPGLEKKYGFIISAVLVSVIWTIWHLPLFFVPGVSQYGVNFILFGIDLIGLTFAYGAIHKLTNSVFLCMLFHCVHNAGSVTFNLSDTLLGNITSTVILVTVSIMIVLFHKRKEHNQNKLV